MIVFLEPSLFFLFLFPLVPLFLSQIAERNVCRIQLEDGKLSVCEGITRMLFTESQTIMKLTNRQIHSMEWIERDTTTSHFRLCRISILSPFFSLSLSAFLFFRLIFIGSNRSLTLPAIWWFPSLFFASNLHFFHREREGWTHNFDFFTLSLFLFLPLPFSERSSVIEVLLLILKLPFDWRILWLHFVFSRYLSKSAASNKTCGNFNFKSLFNFLSLHTKMSHCQYWELYKF